MANIYIRRIRDDKVIQTIRLSNTDDIHVNRVKSGLLINLDKDHYLDDSELVTDEREQRPILY